MKSTLLSTAEPVSYPGIEPRSLFRAALVAAIFYIWAIGSSRFEYFVEQANIDPGALSLDPARWAVLLASGVLVSWKVHELIRLPGHAVTTFIFRPLIHLVVAGTFWILYLREFNPVLSLFAYWMAFTHLVIALGNLFPMLPTDGGKVLDFIITRKWGHARAQNLLRSTSRMTVLCLVIASVIGLSPLILLLALMSHARTQMALEQAQPHASSTASAVRVQDVGLRVPSVSERSTLLEAAEMMVASQSDVLPIRRLQEVRVDPAATVQTASLAASMMISLEHINRIPQSRWPYTWVREAMHPVSHVLSGNQSVEATLDDLRAAPLQTLPWSDGLQVVGIVRYQDVVDGMELLELQRQEEAKRAA